MLFDLVTTCIDHVISTSGSFSWDRAAMLISREVMGSDGGGLGWGLRASFSALRVLSGFRVPCTACSWAPRRFSRVFRDHLGSLRAFLGSLRAILACPHSLRALSGLFGHLVISLGSPLLG